MRMGMMINDLMQSVVHKPVTEKYPFVRKAVPERLRGALRWDSTPCIGCGLCAKDCPSGAIEVIVIDKQAKHFDLLYHVDRCTFCAQCVQSCRQACLTLSNEMWELAALEPGAFRMLYQGMSHGPSTVAAGDPSNP